MVNIEDLEELKQISETNETLLLEKLLNFQCVEIAEFLSGLEQEKLIYFFKKLPEDILGDVFCEFNLDIQNNIYNNVTKKFFSKIFSSMPSESRADFYKQLDAKNQVKVLPFLSKGIRDDVISLSLYSDNTAGGIMSTDFATLYKDMTVQEAFTKLRADAPSKKMIYYAYVVDSEMKMLGFISLRDLILSESNQHISDFLHENYISATVDDDKETVASMIEKYALIAIPVLNDEKQLVGIVRYDDGISVIKEEQTEDMEKMMGIVSDNSNQTYLETSCFQNYYKRVGWIVCLFFLGILTTLVLSHYELLLSQIPVLIPFFPMISAVGGNTGSQTSSVIIRALSLKEIKINDCLKVIFKELQVAFLMSFTLFIFVYCEVFAISYFSKIKNYNPCWVAFVVGLALFLQVVVSMILGALLPLIVKLLNKDPAVVASPAITTIVDVTGILIYFSIASLLL